MHIVQQLIYLVIVLLYHKIAGNEICLTNWYIKLFDGCFSISLSHEY